MSELNFDIEFRGAAPIPPMLREGLSHYINHHQPTGDCLKAILSNDLAEAVFRSDPFTLAALPTIVCFLKNEAPTNCHGSPEKVRAWLQSGESK